MTAKWFWEIKSPRLCSYNNSVARNNVSLALGAAAMVSTIYPFEVLKEESNTKML